MTRFGKHLLIACALIASSQACAKMHGGTSELIALTGERTELPRFVKNMQPALSNQPLLLAEHENDDKSREKSWDDLSDKQKKRIQKRRKEFNALPPEEKQRIRSAREKYRQLPDKHRDELRRKWRDMTPEERARYRHLNHRD